jgi:hypothetical protein
MVIASYQGVRRVEFARLDCAGCLVVENEEVVIKVHEGDPRPRQRFTICHEIAHTFLPGYWHFPQFRCWPGRAEPHNEAEAMCDAAASELLLPAAHVAAKLKGAPFALSTADAIAEQFEASFEASARKMVGMWAEPCALIRLERIDDPAAGEARFAVVSSHSGAQLFQMRRGVLPRTHPVHAAGADATLENGAAIKHICNAAAGSMELHARSYSFCDPQGERHERVAILARHAT